MQESFQTARARIVGAAQFLADVRTNVRLLDRPVDGDAIRRAEASLHRALFELAGAFGDAAEPARPVPALMPTLMLGGAHADGTPPPLTIAWRDADAIAEDIRRLALADAAAQRRKRGRRPVAVYL